MPKKNKRALRRLKLQQELVNHQKEHDRVEYEKLIDNRREDVEEVLIEKSRDFRKFNIRAKTSDIRKDKNVISNKTFNQLKNGFLNTSSKEKFIQQNREHIKTLSSNEQRSLIKLFLNYL